MTTLRVIRGDDFTRTFIWKDSTGTAINIAGYTATFSVTVGTSTTNYTIGSGLTVTAAEGKIVLLIEEDVTALWASSGTFRLRVTSPSDLVQTLVRGNLVVVS